jgi:hypothetical protein
MTAWLDRHASAVCVYMAFAWIGAAVIDHDHGPLVIANVWLAAFVVIRSRKGSGGDQ